MKSLLLGIGLALLAGATFAQSEHYVQGYTKQNGTYVAPHMQTNPDATRANNWSTRGNVNPYTGQPGTKPFYPNTQAAPAPFGQPPFGHSSYNQTPPANRSYTPSGWQQPPN
jgi:hypothetical protein